MSLRTLFLSGSDWAVLHSRRAIHDHWQTSHSGIGNSTSSRPINDLHPRPNRIGRWARDGSGAQYLVGWCSGGDRHHRRSSELSVIATTQESRFENPNNLTAPNSVKETATFIDEN
jgi:hypothetical protein